MAQKIQGSQWNFSAGEVDVALKRADDNPARKFGTRQCSNFRILNSDNVQNRAGRRVLQLAATRTDEITISPGLVFRINFTVDGGGTLKIFDANGAPSFSQAAIGFNTISKIQKLTWAILGSTLYIAGPGFQPVLTTWNGTAWSNIAVYTGRTTSGGQRRSYFYRISPKGVTMAPSAATGNITVQFSGNVLVAGHAGTLMRYIGRQILITAVNNAANANATVIEPLPGSQQATVGSDPRNIFNVGDVVIGSVSGAKGIIIAGGLTSTQINIQLLSTQSTVVPTVPSPYLPRISDPTALQVYGFVVSDILSGPGGSLAVTFMSPIGVPNAVEFWDDEVMNNLRGFPACVFADQNRVGLCNFPAVPNGIGWSAVGNSLDMYVGSQPADAMFELVPDKVQIFYVIAGAESSEFVFADRKVYYIPISVTNPLAPGRVAFNILSGSGSNQVQPQLVDEDIIYVSSAHTITSIVAPGNFYRPYGTRNITEFCSHLINNPIAIAIPTQAGTFAEQYIYVLNADGSVRCGKYQSENGQIKGSVGWVPWSGVGTVNWVSARDAQVVFTTNYPGAEILEALDDTMYLDSALTVNSVPAAMAPGPGQGPLWWQANRSVTLMDQVTRNMGVYQIDANGFIIPQGNGGEDLTIASLVSGQAWIATLEPFAPDAPPGVDQGQRMKKRQFSYFAAYVINSTGFAFEMLFSSQQLPTSPALGTPMNRRDVPAYNAGEDATKPPTQRETVELYAPQGSTFDPRAAIIKDTPGPLLIAEIAMEITP